MQIAAILAESAIVTAKACQLQQNHSDYLPAIARGLELDARLLNTRAANMLDLSLKIEVLRKLIEDDSASDFVRHLVHSCLLDSRALGAASVAP